MIFSYNPNAVGDTLLVIAGNGQGKDVAAEKKGDVARVYLEETNETVGWNIFGISAHLPALTGPGQVSLTPEELAIGNNLLKEAGFNEQLVIDNIPKIVTGFVKSCKKHPDSDHLSITQTEIANDEVVQIVCGAANIKAGLKVVVALPGAMMPDGLMIWPGELRGVASQGMICSAIELGVPNAQPNKGILELPFDTEIGVPFDGASYHV